jgi:uncharacterized protein (DUF2147 family)
MSPIRLALASLISLFCFAFAVSPARAGDASASISPSPIGVWATENGFSRVKIEDCGGKLCGALIWLKQPLN